MVKDYEKEKELLRLIPDELVYEKLTLKNDFIFGKVMQNKENAYDAEMQNDDSKNDLPKRSRYYQGLMDLNLLESGGHYKDLKNSYVIFICTYDPFGEKMCCYEFENMCVNSTALLLRDGRKVLIFNTKGKHCNVTDEVRAFFEYIETGKTNNEFLRRLDLEVEKARKNKEWRIEYMKTWTREMDLRYEGREEGEHNERIRQVTKKIKKGKSLEIIAEEMELDANDIRDIYEQIIAEGEIPYDVGKTKEN